MILAVPVMAEQPWDGYNNASTKYIFNITTTTDSLDGNYTFKMYVNGSNLSLESDCSDLFIVYQDTVEVDRAYEGDCTTDQKAELNVSWKMRTGTTISSSTTNQDWSIWTDPISGEVPSDNKFLVYHFYDDFNDGILNASKWTGGGIEAGGKLDCLGNWENPTISVDIFGGSWQVDTSIKMEDVQCNTGEAGFCNTFSVGGATCVHAPGSDLIYKAGWCGTPSNNFRLEYLQNGNAVMGPTTSYTRSSYFNATIKRVISGDNNGVWRWGGYDNGENYYGTPTDYADPYFFCGGTDGTATAIMLDEVAIHTAVEFEPTYTGNVGNVGRSLYQLSPQDGSVQSGINTNFSCSGEILSIAGINITNITFRIYDPFDVVDNYTVFDVSAEQTNSTTVFFLHNLTTDGTWKYACDMTDTDNSILSRSNDTFTVDTGIPVITLSTPLIESNISNVLATYSVVDATPISCDYSINTGANTSISCTNDGVETITELDLSSIINYGVLNQFYFYANDSLANNNSKVINFAVVERIDEQWMPTGLETESQQFNITLDDALGIISGATLKYDNLDYVGGLLETSGTQKTYGSTINQPAVGSGIETRYFNWSISGTVSANAGATTYPTHSSTIGNIEIVPTTDGSTCDSVDATQYTLNFTFKNETDDALVEGSNLVAWYEVWTTTSSSKLNYTWTESHAGESSYPVCIFPDYAELNANIKLIYGNESEYEYREFNLQNVELNNQTQNYILYQAELGSTTTVTITVQDDVGRVLEGYLVKAILYDYGNSTNPTREVGSYITDPDGIVIMELDASQYYAFEVWKDGTLVHARPAALLTQSEFTIVVTTQELYDVTVFNELNNGITTTLTYSNTTGNVTANWNDAGALGDSYCLNVYNHSSGDNSAFNSQCDIANNGQLIYYLGNSTDARGKWLVRLDVRAVENSVYYTLDELWIDNEENWRTFGIEGLLWGGIIATTTLALLGAPAPAAVIAGTTVTLVVLGNMAEFFSFGWGVMALFILIAGAFIYFMRN
tara:strand:- start:1440 stop:4490 length:3051 start_codon:yes stop_codon:yes gene_type:complete